MIDDDLIDELLDDVAREMTSVPPRADLPARVAARIESETRSRGGIWSRTWLLSPIAVAAVIVVAVVVTRRTPAPAGRVVEPPALVAVAPEPAAPAASPEQRRETEVRAARSEPRVASAQLPAPPPISIQRIELSPIARTDAIEIDPIAIDRIEISPMP